MPRSLIDIAPTLAHRLGTPLPWAQGLPIPDMLNIKGDKTVLLIVDSLCSNVYDHPKMPLFNLREIADKGHIERLLHVSTKTTPAIASILCGTYPEVHKVFVTNDVKKPGVKSVLEVAHESGIPCGMITEREGAEAFKHKITYSVGIEDSDDMISYDENVIKETRRLLQKGCSVVCSHIRTLDRVAHLTEDVEELKDACLFVDSLIEEVAEWGVVLFVCGDHVIHSKI
jgi:hypothetical protein